MYEENESDITASNFNRILSHASAKYVYGLTATPIHKDGHHPIIFMKCGPIRYKVDAKQEAKQRSFDHFVVPRFTSTRMPINEEDREWHITEIYQHICDSNYRNALIENDIEAAINAGRNPLVLTERTSHIDVLVNMLSGKDFQIIVLSGELSAKKRKAALDSIKALSNGDRYVIVAAAKKNILVSSPFLQKKKINTVKEKLIEKYKSGIRITLCIKAISQYSDKQKSYITEFIEEMVSEGISVIQISNNRFRFMIVDHKIVW